MPAAIAAPTSRMARYFGGRKKVGHRPRPGVAQISQANSGATLRAFKGTHPRAVASPVAGSPGTPRAGVDVECAAAIMFQAAHLLLGLQECEDGAVVAGHVEIDRVAGEVIGALGTSHAGVDLLAAARPADGDGTESLGQFEEDAAQGLSQAIGQGGSQPLDRIWRQARSGRGNRSKEIAPEARYHQAHGLGGRSGLLGNGGAEVGSCPLDHRARLQIERPRLAAEAGEAASATMPRFALALCRAVARRVRPALRIERAPMGAP